MTFHDYIDYKMIHLRKLSKASDIYVRRLEYKNCPSNLDSREVDRLKELIGDWETFEPKEEKV